MTDHVDDRCAGVVAKRAAIGEPVEEDFLAARGRRPQMAGCGAELTRRRWQLELRAQQRPSRYRVPDLELLRHADEQLIALEPDDKFDHAADIDLLRRQCASRRAHD